MPQAPYILIEKSTRPDGPAWLFEKPHRIISANTPDDVKAALAAMAGAQADGFYLAGYCAYELGHVWEEKLPRNPQETGMPLLWFGVFDAPRNIAAAERVALFPVASWAIGGLQPAWDEARYTEAFNKVKAYITAGDVYQINLTFPLHFEFTGNAAAFYSALRHQQPVEQGAFIDTGDSQILSLSPELFFALDAKGTIAARPMKGTAPRGADANEDAALKNKLAADIKQRAENLMIVDLLRNDIGRVAAVGSVRVPELYHVESYATLHQMVSRVAAQLKPDVGRTAILPALFPCGSVTGAPKIRAMQIIHELEQTPRGVYTGSIGYFAPDGSAEFNVAIRTLHIQGGKGRMGIGSGVVADSESANEYNECLLKAKFLRTTAPAFQLFETIRLENGTYHLLERHLERLESSARYFGFHYDDAHCREALDEARDAQGLRRVKLTLHHRGNIEITSTIFTDDDRPLWRVRMSEHVLDANDIFLKHKTTRRALYEAELKRADVLGCKEVIFCNADGQLCEGSFTNIFIEKDDMLYTPPLSAGLLPGTFRAELLATGEAVERPLYRHDIMEADAFYVGNSLRGLRPATLVE